MADLVNDLNIGGPRQLEAAKRWAKRQSGEVRVIGWGSKPRGAACFPAIMLEHRDKDGRRRVKEIP